MDLSFSAKSQTFTLISTSAQLSPISSSKTKTHRFRRDFLRGGSSRNLLRPGSLLLRRSICRKLGPDKSHSRRFLVAASLDSNTVIVVVVVAVATISVISIACLNHYLDNKNNRKITIPGVPGSLSSVLSQLGRSFVDQTIGKWFLDTASVVDRGDDLVEKSGEKVLVTEVEEAHVLSQENSLVLDSTVVVPLIKSPDAVEDILASYDVNYVSLRESENGSPLNAVGGVLESGPVRPPMFAGKMSELALENKANPESQVGEPLVKMKPATVTVRINKEFEVVKEGLSSCSGILRESVGEDLYTFYGGNRLVVDSLPNIGGINALSPHASSHNSNSNSNSSLKVKSAEKLARKPLQTAEHIEREVPLVRNDGGSFRENKNPVRSRGSGRVKEKGHLMRGDRTKLPQVPNPNGAHSNDKDNVPSLIGAYNHLLRDGRLSECVDLLEHMERRGLLDMNKVYHAKFFKICKSQNAVNEAFCFFKLVPKPTLSTFNMLMSVCASSQDPEGAFKVLQRAQGNGLKADCKLYTTLISTCAKSGKVDAMFEVFHEMVNTGVEPNVHTYGALIDGCARVGQVAKAFGAYGIMRSKNVKPDRVVFNALISACGQSGAVDRAFDVLAEMQAETQPIDPDHVTVGALMKACAKAGQVDRAQEVYKMVHEYKIKGTPEVYTIAVNCCSQTGDWEFAHRVHTDMLRKGVVPDEMFLSALIDVAGHAVKVDTAFEILQEARAQGIKLGIIPYSSLMGACSNSKNWKKALELYEDMKSIKLNPTVSTVNALITALCDGDQLPKAIEILSEMKNFGLCPNTITYSILLVASERKDDLEVGLMLLSQAKDDCIAPNLIMYKCIIGMCLRRFEKASSVGEPVLSFDLGRPKIDTEWTSLALMVYREAIAAGQMPTMEVVSQVLGCLQLPSDASTKSRLVENLGVTADPSRSANLCSLVDGFGEYDSRAFSLLEEAASLGIVPCVSFKQSPIVVDARHLQIHIAEVYLLTILKGLKHRLAAGAKLPNVTILLPIERTQIMTPKGEKAINLAGRIGRAMASLLRRLGVSYQGNESYGKIRINGISLRRWLQPKLISPFSGKPEEIGSSLTRIGKIIIDQQRSIRTGNLSSE